MNELSSAARFILIGDAQSLRSSSVSGWVSNPGLPSSSTTNLLLSYAALYHLFLKQCDSYRSINMQLFSLILFEVYRNASSLCRIQTSAVMLDVEYKNKHLACVFSSFFSCGTTSWNWKIRSTSWRVRHACWMVPVFYFPKRNDGFFHTEKFKSRYRSINLLCD